MKTYLKFCFYLFFSNEIMNPICVSIKYAKLKKKISTFVKNSLPFIDNKIVYFMDRCFPRWTFNCIKKGKNPFIDVITHEDFVIQSDMEYFFAKHKYLNFDYHQLDWSWLDEEFAQLHKQDNDNLRRSPACELLRSSPVSSLEFQIIGQECIIVYVNPQGFLKRYMITVDQLKRLKSLYLGERELFNHRVAVLVSRYYACGGLRNHFSVPPEIIDYANVHTELFGSPFNTHLDQFCSPFDDMEVYFGSLGNFFDFDLTTGTYIMNPPYDEELIQTAVEKIMLSLATEQEITVICVIPMWDIESQEMYKGSAHSERDFGCIREMINSKYCQSNVVLSFDKHKFYDYYERKYSYIADVHLLVMTNTRYHLTSEDIAKKWSYI